MLSWLESTSLAVWVGESPSVWALPTILTLHTTGLAMLVGASWVLDLRLLGVSRNVPLSAFRWVFPVVAVGLTVNLLTGVLLFMKNATTLATALPFLVKMSLVVVSVATLVPIRAHVLRSVDVSGVPAEAPRANAGVPAQAPRATARVPAEAHAKAGRVRLWAIASILAWTGAVTAGRLLAYLIV